MTAQVEDGWRFNGNYAVKKGTEFSKSLNQKWMLTPTVISIYQIWKKLLLNHVLLKILV